MDCTPLFRSAKKAVRALAALDRDTIDRVLLSVADSAVKNTKLILEENQKDLALMDVSDPRYDRLTLTAGRIENIAGRYKECCKASKSGWTYTFKNERENGLIISKITVPFGVIGIIYEARPNVTFDVFSLCLKSGNACILKGGSDAINSNTAIVKLIRDVLLENGIDQDILTLLPAGRDETIQLLNARGYVDLIIPRGSRNLIDYVRDNASIPVIETGAGICHTYFDEFGDKEKGRAIIYNAKTRRVSVCNALDCLIIHEKRLDDLDYIVEPCADSNVIIYADEKAFNDFIREISGRASSES